MFKNLLIVLILLSSIPTIAQIQVSKIAGKDAGDYKLGYGGFLKLGYPVSDAADISLEVGANIFTLKNNADYGWITIPVKIGYRYTLNQTGTGFYVQPQVGYNAYGVDPRDNKFSGPILAGGTGYLFGPLAGIQFDLGLLFESAFAKGQQVNYLSLRLTHNIMLRRRSED